MTLRGKMILSSGFVLLLIFSVGLIVLLAYARIPSELGGIQETNYAIQNIFSIDVAVNDYHFRRIEAARERWESRLNFLKAHLWRLESTEVDSGPLGRLRSDLATIEPLFPELIQAQEDRAQERGDRIVDRITLTLFSMVRTAHELIHSMQNRLDAAQRTSSILVLSFILVIAGIVLVASFLFSRTIVAPIRRIKRGMEKVARGDLEQRVPVLSRDELGQLANGFNYMTGNLSALSRMRDEFLSTAAHELKTPITVLKANVQLFAEDTADEREKHLSAWVAIINQQCDRLNKLIQELLDISRLQLGTLSLRRENFDFGQLLRDVVARMQKQTSRHSLVIRQNIEAEIFGDRDRIGQVMTNLLDNAIKYSPGGGEIEIRAHESGGKVVTFIHDPGIGIPRTRQSKVFDRFYRAHAGTPYDYATSLGIGLHLAFQFIQRHGGKMWFESEEGKGSTFSFSLPIGSS